MLPTDLDVAPDPLRLRLDFHAETVVMHDFESDGLTSVRIVHPLDVARTLAAEIDLSTGILPPDCLWYARTSTGDRVAIWCPPRVWPVSVKANYDAPALDMKLPMPGLVFICQHSWRAPFVFAAKERPMALTDQLYKCPTFNVFANGGVCSGNHTFLKDPARVPADFFKSFFSLAGDDRNRCNSHPDDLLGFWKSINGKKTFPLDELQPILQVQDAMRVTQ